MIRRALAVGAALLGLAGVVLAQEGQDGAVTLQVCFNYGCIAQAEVTFAPQQLAEIAGALRARNAAEERALLGPAIGRLYAWAGAQSPIAADKGGNLADEAVYGRMDCIDHSLTTTRFLRLLEARGMLRYHSVDERVLRSRFLFFEHYAAQIVERDVAPRAQAGVVASDVQPVDAGLAAARFAVDSWFFDNGQPAVILPLADWKAGEGPDVGW